MAKLLHPLTLCLAMTLAMSARVAPLAAQVAGPEVPQVELLSPVSGDELVGGTTATIAWSARGEIDPRIVEWEAFLSFDGGRYYAMRITPHLEIGKQRFSFQVPGIVSDDVRLMLRFGDERREVGLELPHRFTITASRGPLPVRPARPAVGRGESARPGEAGVMVWVEGSRDGRNLERWQAPIERQVDAPILSAFAATWFALLDRTLAGLRPPPAALTTLLRRSPPRRWRSSPLLPTSILLLGCRQNE